MLKECIKVLVIHLLTMTGKKCFYYIQKKQSYNK